jgi:hypothetical protein
MIETVIKPVNDARPVNSDAKHSRHASNKSSAVAELRTATATPLPYSASNWRYAVASSCRIAAVPVSPWAIARASAARSASAVRSWIYEGHSPKGNDA